ncbi:MAG TPA: hypothetical protein VN300_07130, partial [Desulfobacterales bacterium]|nr:hypothetical protein [Desulfobacterales bacterium]
MRTQGMQRFWIIGFTAAAVFTALLLARMDALQGFLGATQSLADLKVQRVAARDSWMSIFQNQRRIGYAHRRLNPGAAGYELKEKIVMRINT